MVNKENPYRLAGDTWGQEEIDAINEVVASGMFTMGEKVKRFEDAFAKKMGSKYAVMVNSGSSANLIAIAAFFYKSENPLKPGDEVIVPAVSWATTYYPLMQYGLKLRFVDIDLQTLNMDVTQLEEAITPKTRMILAVNVLGNPCELDVIRQCCNEHDLYFFEDNCESMGASLNGRLCGTFGDIGTFSCFFSHHISTMEGGICVTDDEELYHLMLSLRSHGWTRHLPEATSLYEKGQDDVFEDYRFILPGYNLRPTELNGAIGIEQLKKLDEFISVRRDNAAIWQDLFKDDERFIIQKEHGKSSWFSFTAILNPEMNFDRHKIMAKLKDNHVEHRMITGGNFIRHDVAKYCDYTVVHSLKNADIAHDRGLFVGNHPYDISDELKHFYEVLDQVAQS